MTFDLFGHTKNPDDNSRLYGRCTCGTIAQLYVLGSKQICTGCYTEEELKLARGVNARAAAAEEEEE